MKRKDAISEPPPAGLLRLFVYGTLKHGFCNHERFCKGASTIEEATVRGRLYELPSGIPVIKVPTSDIIAVGTDDVAHDLLIQDQNVLPVCAHADQSEWSKIRGELMLFDDSDRRLQTIDALEGFAPHSHCLYCRVLLPVYRQDGTVVAAWGYVLGLESVHLAAINSSEWWGFSIKRTKA